MIPWEHGGETKISNLVMLCKTHHREIHTSEWAVQIAPDGIPEFTPPKWTTPKVRLAWIFCRCRDKAV